MKYRGVAGTDTHQGESELVYLEWEGEPGTAPGTFTVRFGPWDTEGWIAAPGPQSFTWETLTPTPEGFKAHIKGRFECHQFKTTALDLEIRGTQGFLGEPGVSRPMKLSRVE